MLVIEQEQNVNKKIDRKEIAMPSHYGSGMGVKKKKSKSMLTAKQKTLPEALKKKIIKSKMKKA